MKLIFENNLITRSVACIFVNDKSMGLEYKNAEQRGITAEDLFKNVLDFEDVQIYHN